jgi:hypothetical protein
VKVAVNIKVRNPEPLTVAGQENDSMIVSPDSANHGYSLEIDFEFLFDVIKYVDLKESEFYLPVYLPNRQELTLTDHQLVILKDVTVIGFIGAKAESYVTVSSDLIHKFTPAGKVVRGRLYWNIVLREDARYVRVADNIWLSKSIYEGIVNLYGSFTVVPDRNLKRRKFKKQLTSNTFK